MSFPPHSHYRGIGVFPEKLLMGRKNCVHRIILSRRFDEGWYTCDLKNGNNT